jgi:hypothetical protein
MRVREKNGWAGWAVGLNAIEALKLLDFISPTIAQL